MYRKSYCTTPGIGIDVSVTVGIVVSKMLWFLKLKLFYGMDKALTGEKPCPLTGIDRNWPLYLFVLVCPVSPSFVKRPVVAKYFLLMQDSCQTDWNLLQDKISICRTVGIFVVRTLFSLLRFTGHLSDRLKVFAGHNENLLVLSSSPALFTKTERLTPYESL